MAATACQDLRTKQTSKYKYVESLVVSVRVGEEPEAQYFSVHEGLICPRSEFFRNALNGSWKESKDRTMPLPEDEPEIFSIYLQLLYSDRIFSKNIVDADSEAISDEYATLSKLFVLAEKLMDETSKAVILAALAARAMEPASQDQQLYYPGIDSIQIIYHGTPEDSPAREWLVDVYTKNVTSSFITDKSAVVPKDFLQDLSVSLLTKRPLAKRLEVLKEEKKKLLGDLQNRSKHIAKLESEVDELKRRRNY